ncbi:MAG TPA: superoxide dismutase, Ni [Mycobacteriales bacterium]|nr:superoxide dismutase, Ni [Mycobacteriales bacterium]
MVHQIFAPRTIVHAHCDLPCGIYDPAQARIEAQAVKACMEKHATSDDAQFRQRAVLIKEERAELVKHHLWVLWTDYFKPPHLEAHPELHQLIWDATKAAGAAKGSLDVADAQRLLDLVDQVDEIFKATKKA